MEEGEVAKRPIKRKLPRPNVEVRFSDEEGELTPAEIRGMVCNPIYAGFGPFPPLVSDEQWVAAAGQFIKKEGTEQFLVNLLFVLRKTFEEYPD